MDSEDATDRLGDRDDLAAISSGSLLPINPNLHNYRPVS